MGKLKYIELENFKSYSGTQIIGPFDDFTAIIGPNGAGKSNMMDAISFVLGVQSRHLRSSHLKELIYRKDAESPPARRAGVKLIYESSNGEIDGSEGSEIQFSRSISATGVSTYRINGKETTFDAYENFLQKIGVLVKARNFLVFQGDVESVASKSPAELTNLLEQISGSDQLKAEYDDLKQKKDEAEENAIFSMQKKKMYTTQKREVLQQRNEAEQYQKEKERLDDLKTEHMLWQVFRIKSGMEEHQQLRRQLLDELSRINDQDGDLENEIANCKSNLARLNKNVVSVDKDYTHKEKSLSKITPKVTVAKDQIKSFDKRVTELVKVESKIQADYVAQSESIKGLKSDLEKLLRAEESLKLQFEASTASGLHLDKAKLDEYSTLRLEVSAQTSRERSEQVLIENELSSKRQRIQELEFQESYAKQEIESIDSQLVDSRNRLEKISGEIGTFNSELANLVSSRDSINDLSVKCEQERNKLLRESEEVTARLQDAGDARQRSKQEDKMNSAIEAMQRIFPGVKGKLADLCKPVQKKYAQAISVAAGKHMDAIVVDSKQVAADCIRYLKDQRIGTCSFLPLDNISPKPVQERLRGLGSSYRLCCDLIESDDRYRPAVMYAVGSSIVCDTLEEAQDLCFRRNESVKVVTLNGHVISKSGSMTGGSTSREKHDRWEIKEIENLRHSKVELDEKLAENKRITPNRQTIVDIEIRLKTIQGKIDYTVAEKEMLDQKIQQLTHQRDMSTKHMRDLRKDIVKLQKDMDTKTRQLSAIIEQVRSVEATVFSAFSASMGVENIREFEETQLQQHNELVANMAVIGEQRASLLAQVEYENKRDFSGALQRQKAQISEVRQNIELKQKELLALTQEENKLRSQIAESAAKKASAHNERKEAENLVKSLQAQKSNINAEKDAVTKKVTGEEIQIEKLRGQLHELLQRAQVEEIALPTVETGNQEEAVSALDGDAELQWTGSRIMSMSLDSTGGERRRVSQRTSTNSNRDSGVGSSTQHSLHFSQSENSLMQQEEGRLALVDLSSIRREASKMDVKRQLEKQQQLAQDIELLTEELTKIQPNMHAAERYEGVIEKLRDCSDNLDSVQQVAKSVSTRFEEVRELRQQLFMECYNHVSTALTVIYKDLTMSSKHPLGGNAYLTLDNMDEPYLSGTRYTAMPPSKRFRDMDQLSGGEKTVAALALLFSIHSFRQAPFFVLDEVDAALDNVNVQKVCNYIRKQSANFQCVVISLKDMFFEHADLLVGVCKDINSLSSRVLTLDLKKYPVAGDTSTTTPSKSNKMQKVDGGDTARHLTSAMIDDSDGRDSITTPLSPSETPTEKRNIHVHSTEIEVDGEDGDNSSSKRKPGEQTKRDSRRTRARGTSLQRDVIVEEESEEPS